MGTVRRDRHRPLGDTDCFSRYLLFVRAGNWHLTPVTNWSHTAFQEVEVAGRRIFVSQSGRGVTALGPQGFQTGPQVARGSAEQYLEFIDPSQSSAELRSASSHPVQGPESIEQADELPGAPGVLRQLRELIRAWVSSSGTAPKGADERREIQTRPTSIVVSVDAVSQEVEQ